MKGRYDAQQLISTRVVTVEKGELSTVLDRLTEYGKVLLVVGNADYLRVGERITDEIDECSQSFYRFTVEKGDTFREFAPMFSLPEDVRAVLAVGNTAIPCAKYFCSLRNVPYAFLPLSPDAEDVFCPTVMVDEGESLTARLPEFVVVTPLLYECPRGQIAAAYGRMISKFIAQIDYRVRCLCTACAMQKSAYDAARLAVTDVLALHADSEKARQIETLLSASLRFSALFAEYGDDSPCYGAEKEGAALLAGGEYGDRAFACAVKLVGIYRLALQYVGVSALTPDYERRLLQASKISGICEQTLLNKMQIPRFSDHEKRVKLLQNFRAELDEELQKIQELLPVLKQIYRAYGGTYLAKVNAADLRQAVCFAPELSSCYNLATFIRDAGFMDGMEEK